MVEGQPRNSASSKLLPVACAALILACVGALLQYQGPFKGWADRLKAKISPPPSTPAVEKAPTVPLPSSPPTPVPTPGEEQEETPQKLDKDPLEARYDQLYGMYLKQLSAPKLGETVKFRLLDGQRVSGRLAELTPGRVEVALEYGSMTFPVHRVREKDARKLFPAKVAREKAMADIRKIAASALEISTASEKPGTAASGIQEPGTVTDSRYADDTRQKSGKLTYDPAPGRTPDALRPTLKAFGTYLEAQHRRVGGRIARKLYAKRQGRAAVLYMVMDEVFIGQEYDIRFQMAEGLQKFWAFRCAGAKLVGDLNNAHLVMLDERGRVVGGSTPADADQVWVKLK